MPEEMRKGQDTQGGKDETTCPIAYLVLLLLKRTKTSEEVGLTENSHKGNIYFSPTLPWQ